MTLLRSRSFLPLFVTQFLGAFNDNLLKNALVMLITFKLAATLGQSAQLLVIAAAGLFILPFFLFSATAGEMADRYDRARLTRLIKLAEIAIMLVAIGGFYTAHVTVLLVALFGMGLHSTFFGPIKYALLPQHLAPAQLLAGNAYIEAGTFLAILLGTIAGGLLVLQPAGATLISAALLVVAVTGYLTSRAIPAAPAPQPDLPISWNIAAATVRVIAQARQNRRVFRAILGISWFWLVGATFLAQFPAYAKNVLHADETVVTLFLTLFSLGVGAGSFLCNRLVAGRLTVSPVPVAAILLSLFGIDLYLASLHPTGVPPGLLTGAIDFMREPHNWRLLGDLLGLSLSAGLYIVPLYAVMQHDSDPVCRARIIAANNILNALFMVAAAVLSIVLLARGFTIPQIFLGIALLNLAVAGFICSLLPDAVPRLLLKGLFKLLYRVEVTGLDHYAAAGPRVLIIANHTSFLDAALIAAFLPAGAPQSGRITFAINTHIARSWWMRPLLALVDALPVDPANPLAIKTLIDTLKRDRPCMIFPEGRITTTGALMKIYDGPGLIADKTGAMLLPVRIDGAQYTPFSRLRGAHPRRWFPKITLTILPPERFDLPPELKGRQRRQQAGNALYRMMSEMMFASSPYRRTLITALLDAQTLHGRAHVIVEDAARQPLSYGDFTTRAGALGRLLCWYSAPGERVGVLLPTSITGCVTFFALLLSGRVPALLNYTAGPAQIEAACRAATLKTVLTSRRFVAAGRLQPLCDTIAQTGVSLLYLEDLAERVTRLDKITAFLGARWPSLTICKAVRDARNADTPAVVLFTSGSEGLPKGVVLSHANILANIHQLASRIDFGAPDRVFNALPMFHAFGLLGGTLLPLLCGIKSFYYPSPLHYRIIPELVYDTNSTILFGTDTFLAGYARFANPYDFYTVRYIFAGAEKLKDETRRLYADKFGVRVFEGYGATETAPGIAINTALHNRINSVGQLLPGLAIRLEDVPGITSGQKLWVKRPNVMRGYLYADRPGELVALPEGWYDTGDIVRIDAENYMFIEGRTKRFAKIAGEMVSLAAVETALQELWPDAAHAVTSIPDAKKGEQLVVLTTQTDPARDVVGRHFKDKKLPDIAVPRSFVSVPELPLLGSGKVDYQAAKAVALSHHGVS